MNSPLSRASLRVPGPSFSFGLLFLLTFAPFAQAQTHAASPGASTSRSAAKAPAKSGGSASSALSKPKLTGADVMATVEGQPITRRELTTFWLQLEPRLLPSLGELLAEKYKAGPGPAATYTIPEAAIYARLYGTPGLSYANLLSNLVSNHLVTIEAQKRGILVTPTETKAEGHVLLEDLRVQRGVTGDDAHILAIFHIPLTIFQNEISFRLRIERLIRDDISRKNGHTVRHDDWIVVRQLFAAAEVGADGSVSEAQYIQTRTRIETWLEEIKGGKRLAEVARDHNEDNTRLSDGIHGPILIGTESPVLNEALRNLKSGALSRPIRTPAGYYVFAVERRGDQIGEAERSQAWKQLVAARQPAFIADLRRNARITSVVPLPNSVAPATGNADPPAPPK